MEGRVKVVTISVDSGKTLLLQELRPLLPSLRSLNDAQAEKKIGKERLDDAVELIFNYLAVAAPGCRQVEQRAVLSRCLHCLTDWMQSQEIPWTVKTVFDCIYQLPFAVDRAFPFYAQAGLLRAVVSPTRLSQKTA
jgi:hypothetical protein